MPQEVVEIAIVTIAGSMKHLTAVWTAGDDESVTNTVRGGSFLVRKGTEDVTVIFAFDPACELVSGNLLVELGTVDGNKTIKDVPQVVHRTIVFVDRSGQTLINNTFSVVTAATDTFAGGWYLVEGDVVSSGIDVQEGCEVHLILADGASLTVAGTKYKAGIDVGPSEALSIYGQAGGTGRLTATGGDFAAGIGGGDESSSDGSVYRDEERVELVDGDVGSDYSFVKFAEIWTGPTCEGGDIAEGKIGEWVITPDEGVTEVTITGLAEGETVAIRLGDYVVPSAAFVGFGEGKTEGVFSLALDEAGEVNGVRVQPIIGELDENEGAPFVVGEGGVTVTVKAIPGLKYELVRGTSVESVTTLRGEDAASTVDAASCRVTETTVTLKDNKPPEGAAFYRVVVSVP